MVAGDLTVNGVLSADGQDEDSPTLAFPRPEQTNGAATGAGGALQVHAQKLSGSGSIEAKGGGLNLPPSMGIGQPDAGGFTQADGANGAGGGGDVLVVAPKRVGSLVTSRPPAASTTCGRRPTGTPDT